MGFRNRICIILKGTNAYGKFNCFYSHSKYSYWLECIPLVCEYISGWRHGRIIRAYI